MRVDCISIHAPSRERQIHHHHQQYLGHISIHAPSRERHPTHIQLRAYSIFQSTLPRGSDYDSYHSDAVQVISIHAPSRERLQHRQQGQQRRQISIHAPSRERQVSQVKMEDILKISIHAPSRERQVSQVKMEDILKISIHAPSRERRSRSYGPFLREVFQSTLPRGSDFSTEKHLHIYIIFQSTLPRGSDAIQQLLFRLLYNFNPRSLAGATDTYGGMMAKTAISIHAPSRERL